MEQLLDQLVLHLEQEHHFLESYLATLKKQSKLVAAVKIDELNENVNQLAQISRQNDVLSVERSRLFEALSQETGLPVEQVTISYMISTLNEPWRKRLKLQKKNLVDMINQIQIETRTNAFILNYAITFTHSLIQMQDKALQQDAVYSKNGRKNERIDQNKIINKKC